MRTVLLSGASLWGFVGFLLLLSVVNGAARTKQFISFLRNENRNSTYYSVTSGCVEDFYKTRTTQGNPPRYCRLNNVGYISSASYSSNNTLLTCQYSIRNFRYRSNNIEFNVLSTGGCIQGGSSFAVMLCNEKNCSQFVWCEYDYDRNLFYNFSCTIPPSSLASHGCNALQVLVDYEDYNAYHERGAMVQPLQRVVPQEVKLDFCPDGTKPDDLPMTPSSNALDVSRCLGQHPVYLIGSSHMRYVWDAIVDKYLEGREKLQSLTQHHSDASVGQVHYVNSLFVMRLPALLDSICASIHDALAADVSPSITSNNTRWRVVVQSLAWDLDYHPVGNVLQYPSSVPALVESVRRLASLQCGQYIDFTWVTAVPVPPCNASDSAITARSSQNKRQANGACSFEGRGYRNNHAIAAANEYIVEKLSSIMIRCTVPLTSNDNLSKEKKSYKRTPKKLIESPFVRVVDAFGLIYPTHSESVCGLHYSCAQHRGKKGHPQKSVEILHTPGGEAVIDSIIQSVCKL